jgi:predicted transcriptional regulator
MAEVRKLSAADQDETAEMLLWSIETRAGSLSLDSETITAIDEGLAQARRGEFASDAEIEALWKRRDGSSSAIRGGRKAVSQRSSSILTSAARARLLASSSLSSRGRHHRPEPQRPSDR